MDSEQQSSTGESAQSRQDAGPGSMPGAGSSGDELVNELGRLGRKFLELLETAWNSEQRRQIEQDLRKGLNSVADSLEDGLKDLGEKEQTKEFIGKAESVADNVGEKVRSSDAANELAKGLASGLHVLADQLDRLASEMRTSQSTASGSAAAREEDGDESQDIPITHEPPTGAGT